jgi:hypothetical protein
MTSAKSCPACGGALTGPMTVDVCGSCYQDMVAGGGFALQATGEFGAMSMSQAEEALRPVRPRSLTGAQSLACSWCGKPRAEVKKILSGQSAHICNECVALCADIMESELGPEWKG